MHQTISHQFQKTRQLLFLVPHFGHAFTLAVILFDNLVQIFNSICMSASRHFTTLKTLKVIL